MLSNPVLHKELMRMRMRQGRPVRMALLTIAPLGVAYFYWLSISYLLRNQLHSGRDVWMITVMIQFLLIGLLTPAATANAISQEREQQTWDMLLQTRLTPKQIIFGKLAARLAPSLAVILLGLPITTACLLIGGRENAYGYYERPIDFGTFLLAPVGMLIIAAFFATFGLYMSMKYKRTLYALLATYGFLFGVLSVCTVMLTGMLQMFTRNNNRFMEEFPLMWINPFYIAGEIFGNNDARYVPYVLIGLCVYAAATALLLTRMIFQFRRMAIER